MRIHPRGWMSLGLMCCWAALASASDVRSAETATPAPAGSHQHHHQSQTADERLKAKAGDSEVLAAEVATPAPLGSHQHGLRTTADG